MTVFDTTNYTGPLSPSIKVLACSPSIKLATFPQRYKMHSSKSFDKRLRLLKKERYFQMVCEQIVVLNHKILRLQKRYKKTNQDNMRSLRYNMRLRLTAVEGVRNMFYDYAYNIANQIAELRRELFGETVHILTESAMEDMAE